MFPVPRFIQGIPVVSRWMNSAFRSYARNFRHQYTVEERFGLLFLLDQVNAVDRNLLLKGNWENKQIAFLTGLVRAAQTPGRRMVFCDIGAHGGLYAMLMQRTGAFATIIAIEPDPVNVVQLRANLLLNTMLEQIRIVEAAATDQTGVIDFFIAIDSHRGGSRIGVTGEAPLARKTTVKAMRADDVINEKGVGLVIKIDVETYEMQVLAGLEQSLRENDCILQIEIFPDNLDRVTTHLASLGYERIKTIVFDHYFVAGRRAEISGPMTEAP